MKNEWDVDAAIATYNVDGWGGGYFTVNPTGNVAVRPLQENGGTIDILEVVNEARNRGLSFPLVIRFQDLLRHRVESVNRAFQEAITEFGYKNEYRGVFPIKVNQLREVIEEIVDAGQQFHFGLEAGSKPELVAALAMHQDPESLIICNGYKDAAFIRIALLWSITWVMRLTTPWFVAFGNEISGRDMILLVGGLFLIAKSTHEIHDKLESRWLFDR